MDVSSIPGDATYFRSASGSYVSVEYDRYPVSPRGYGEGVATFLTWGARGSIDDNPYSSPDAFVDDVLGAGASARCRSMQDVMRAFRARGYVIEGVYRPHAGEGAYEVGEANPYSDVPGSGPCGFAFVSPDDMLSARLSPDAARVAMRREIEAYSAYAEGSVWRVCEYAARNADLARVRSFYGLDEIERAYPVLDPIPVASEVELAVYARLSTDWEHLPATQGDPRERYAKGDVAIVSEGSVWRLASAQTMTESVESYETAVEALAAFEGYCSLDRTLGSDLTEARAAALDAREVGRRDAAAKLMRGGDSNGR